MNIKERIYRLKKYNVVQHAKFNPKGQGIVKIQLLPSKIAVKNKSDIIILNNKYVVPIAPAWSILLSHFLANINEQNGKIIDGELLLKYINDTVEQVSKIYISVPKKMLENDLKTILKVLQDVAYGKKLSIDIGQKTIAEYSKYMIGPHRIYFMMNNVETKENKHCNNRCLHYSAKLNQQLNHIGLTKEEWKEVIKKCKNACIPHIIFCGGKPTEREDLVEIIDECKWFQTTLLCTGKKLTKEYTEQLFDAGLDNVVISLYSSNVEIHNKLAGEDNYNLVIEGIKNAIASKLYVALHIPICRLNSEVLETIKFAQKLGITTFNISVMDYNEDNKENFVENELTKNDIFEILKEISSYADQKSLQINFETPNFINEEKLESIKIDPPICGAMAYEITILPDGNIVPCSNVCSDKYILGNILTDSWNKIWNSVKCKRIRKLALINSSTCPIKRYVQK